MDQFPLQAGSVSQVSLVVMKRVVQVGHGAVCAQIQWWRCKGERFFFSKHQTTLQSALLTMELVQSSQMIQKRFQRLGDREKLQKAVDDYVKDGQEAQTYIAEVDWQVLRLELHGRADLVCKPLKVQLLWVFLIRGKNIFNFKCDLPSL